MTAETHVPSSSQAAPPPRLIQDWTPVYQLALALLVVLVVGLAFGVVSLNSKLDELRTQVASLPSGASTGDTVELGTRLDDVCRALGALAFTAGVDLPTAFANEGATGTCEAAAEGAFQRVTTR